MGRITVDLLRRRAEHNEGCLSNLKEVALHQQDLEKIELIGDACRQLEIIYLCNNYISKIEGLYHLKWLRYLNLAVNNITIIGGLEGCEALERLDLTLNFIADLTSVRALLANPALVALHLTGNPCTRQDGYRDYVISALPQLTELDGDVVARAERITARQTETDVNEATAAAAARHREAELEKAAMVAEGVELYPAKYNEKGERVYGHTPEERLQMLREQQETEERARREREEPAPGSLSALHKELKQKPPRLTPEEELKKYGRLLLRNEAGVPFHLDQDDDAVVVLTVEPGKFISTTLISVEVEIHVIRVVIKGKLLQLPVEDDLAADRAAVQRSATTGQLKITAPWAAEVSERRRGAKGKVELSRMRKPPKSAAAEIRSLPRSGTGAGVQLRPTSHDEERPLLSLQSTRELKRSPTSPLMNNTVDADSTLKMASTASKTAPPASGAVCGAVEQSHEGPYCDAALVTEVPCNWEEVD